VNSESLFIDGEWRHGRATEAFEVINPATGETLRELTLASAADLDAALAAAERGFRVWRSTAAYSRSGVLRAAAQLVRERTERIASLITLEQGKPLPEARLETQVTADVIDWYADEARRAYGRIVPSRAQAVRQMVTLEPIGPVAAFSPWNFPLGQAVRKIAAALAAGCSIVIKPAEHAPSCCIELCRAFQDAGLPAGVLNAVFGVPDQVSRHLIPARVIRKVSFTGSTAVGRRLNELAASHLKPATLELGGHAPFIIFEDVDAARVAAMGVQAKFRNAGQICTSPSRFYVHEKIFDVVLNEFSAAAAQLRIGPGDVEGVQMGPLAHARRVTAMESLVEDARARGARVVTGGTRSGERGNFFRPAVLTDVPPDARVLHEEPFGPIAPFVPFSTFEQVVELANASPYGLGAYAFTRSMRTAGALADALDCGMVSINHFGLALPEIPFGGVKESGHGSEGGKEGLDAYLTPKLITQNAA
jgi:succinate-semialdehyde dehydrogenase/glutarate-semialdehyde dehydrogenase